MDSSDSKVNYERELQLTQVSENILYRCLSVYPADMLHNVGALCSLGSLSIHYGEAHDHCLIVNDVS